MSVAPGMIYKHVMKCWVIATLKMCQEHLGNGMQIESKSESRKQRLRWVYLKEALANSK